MIDTLAERASALIDPAALPFPDGAVSKPDRGWMLGFYAGIDAAERAFVLRDYRPRRTGASAAPNRSAAAGSVLRRSATPSTAPRRRGGP